MADPFASLKAQIEQILDQMLGSPVAVVPDYAMHLKRLFDQLAQTTAQERAEAQELNEKLRLTIAALGKEREAVRRELLEMGTAAIFRDADVREAKAQLAAAEQENAQLKVERDRETELRRKAESHAQMLVATLDQKPYTDEYDNLEREVKALQQEIASLRAQLAQYDADVRQFIGWLSVDIPELHHVEVPLLADSYERFKLAAPLVSDPPHNEKA